MATGWDILDKPLQTAKKWQKILDRNDKKEIAMILRDLMYIAVASCKVNKELTFKEYQNFFKQYNQLDSFKVKCEDYDEHWTVAEGIQFLKNLVHDIIRLEETKEFKAVAPNLVMFVGIFLWLQRGVKFEDIADQDIGLDDESDDSSDSNDEEDSIDDDLPYFGSSSTSKKEEKKPRRKLVKKSKASKKEVEQDDEDDQYQTNLSQAKAMFQMAIDQINEQELDENNSSLFAMSTFLAFLDHFGLVDGFLKNYDDFVKIAKKLNN